MKQTAVEWLEMHWAKNYDFDDLDLYLIGRAKEMEKEQILAAHSDWSRITENLPTRSAVQYFKETFKSE